MEVSTPKDEVKLVEAPKAKLPAKGVVRRVALALKEFIGHFAQWAFWKELITNMCTAGLQAFIAALGGVLIWGGRRNVNPEVQQAQNVGGFQPGYQAPPSSFNNGFAPSSSYSSPQQTYRPSPFVPMTRDNAPSVFPGL